jgi:hypothetical protein
MSTMDTPEKVPVWLWAAWAASVLGTSGGVGTATLFGALFLRPHAFSNRDGQGAAALAALVMFGALAVTLLGSGALVFSARRLRQRHAVRWPVRVSLGVPLAAGALGVVAALLG